MITDLPTTPQYHVSCSSPGCSHHASWIVPRPHLLPMVKEIALRSGWDDSGFCYVCRSVVPHEKWSLGDVEHMDRMRHQGWPWSKIAAHMVKHGHPHASEAKVLQAWERGRGKLA